MFGILPRDIPRPPNKLRQLVMTNDTSQFDVIDPQLLANACSQSLAFVNNMNNIATGPTALLTSFPPCANAGELEAKININVRMFQHIGEAVLRNY